MRTIHTMRISIRVVPARVGSSLGQCARGKNKHYLTFNGVAEVDAAKLVIMEEILGMGSIVRRVTKK